MSLCGHMYEPKARHIQQGSNYMLIGSTWFQISLYFLHLVEIHILLCLLGSTHTYMDTFLFVGICEAYQHTSCMCIASQVVLATSLVNPECLQPLLSYYKECFSGQKQSLCVTGPVTINYVSINYTKFIFLLISLVLNVVWGCFCQLHMTAH